MKNGMIITIPTGNRAEKAFETVRKWRQQGIPVVAYVWDAKTFRLLKHRCFRIFRGERKSFPILQNSLIKSLAGIKWKGIICGADDLWPGVGMWLLEKVCVENDEKVLWFFDGLNSEINTHPVITRGWYEKHKTVFDEGFRHNCCDSDLMVRTWMDGELIRVRGITFNHRHPMNTPIEERDSIYRLGFSYLKEDDKYFRAKHPKVNPVGIRRSVPVLEI